MLTSELLSRACGDAALYDGERNIHFAAFPGEDTLTMEVVYSGELPQKAPFDWKGKTLSQTPAAQSGSSPRKAPLPHWAAQTLPRGLSGGHLVFSIPSCIPQSGMLWYK